MANLLGKADQTLVKGAYSVAKANLPGDMSGVYDQRAKNMEGLMAGISTVWEELNSEWNDRQNALSTKGDAVYENVLTGKYNDQMVEATDAAVLDIKSRLKGQKADKKGVGARKIEAEMNSFAKNTQQNALDFEELADLSKNNELIIKGSGSEAKLLEAIFDDFNNNTNNTQVTYKDGNFTYTLDGVSMTMGDIKKAMIKKDNTKPSAVQKIFNEVVTKAGSEKRESSDVYKNDIKNRIKSSMTNKSDKTNIMHSHFEGLQYTFYEALTGKDQGLQDQIFDTLMAVGTDIDKDGVADTKDTYLNTENAVALQREILNNDNSGDIIAGFLTDNLFQDAYDRGVKERKVIKTGGKKNKNDKDDRYGGWGAFDWTTKGTKDQAGVYIKWKDAESRRNDLNNFRNVGGEHGFYTWDENLGKDGMYVDEQGDEFTMYKVAEREGLIMSGEGKGDFNPTRTSEANEENENLNKGLASPSMLQDTGSMGSQDNNAAEKLNSTFSFTSVRDSDYFFVPYTSNWTGEGGVSKDNIFSNDIMLIDGSTNRPVGDGNGNVKSFGTGSDYSKNDLDWINNFLGEYAGKQDIDTEFED